MCSGSVSDGTLACKAAVKTPEYRDLVELLVLRDQRSNLRQRKVLILGTAGAGKSTFMRSMKHTFTNQPLTPKERTVTQYSLVAGLTATARSIMDASRAGMFHALPTGASDKTTPALTVAASPQPLLSPVDVKTLMDWDEDMNAAAATVVPVLLRLFAHPTVKRLLRWEIPSISTTRWVSDTPFTAITELLDRLPFLVADDSLVAMRDRLLTRTRTTGIVVSNIDITPFVDEMMVGSHTPAPAGNGDIKDEKHDADAVTVTSNSGAAPPGSVAVPDSWLTVDPYRLQFVDVGSPRDDRKKWIHCFDDISQLVYCCDLDRYDSVMFEDSTKSVLLASIEVFGTFTYQKFWSSVPVLLVFTRLDAFELKLKARGGIDTSSDIQQVWRDYSGDRANARELIIHLAKQFSRQMPQKRALSVIALDSTNAKSIECAGRFLCHSQHMRNEINDKHWTDYLAEVTRELDKYQKLTSNPPTTVGNQQREGEAKVCPVTGLIGPLPSSHVMNRPKANGSPRTDAVAELTQPHSDSRVTFARCNRPEMTINTAAAFRSFEAEFETVTPTLRVCVLSTLPLPLWLPTYHLRFPLSVRRAIRTVLVIWSMRPPTAASATSTPTSDNKFTALSPATVTVNVSSASSVDATAARRHRYHPISRLARDNLYRIFQMFAAGR